MRHNQNLKGFLNLPLLTAITFFLSFAIISASCSRDPVTNNTPDNLELLTAKEWILQSAEEKIGNSFWVLQPRADCDKDNRFIFKTDKKFVFTDGAVKCDPNEPDIIDIGTWIFQESETKLQLYFDSEPDPVIAEILLLNETHLTVSSSYTDAGVTTYGRETFIHP